MTETDSKYHLQKWNENIKLYNEKYNTKYTYKYIVENFTEVIKFTNDEYLLLNPHDDGHHVLNGQSCNLCMCDTRIIDRFYIFDPNNETNKMIVGCKCISKIDEDIDRINIFNMTCNKCNNLYPFKANTVNGDLCKVCYKANKDLIKQHAKETLRLKEQEEQELFLRQKEQEEQELQIKLKNEIHKCKCGKGTFKIPFKCCYNCNKIDALLCKCGKTYKKPFKQCYNCNILNKHR
jgi:hypothetical protein